LLYKRAPASPASGVRCPAIFLLVFGFVPELWAQQQERGLVDRLLRPDMELQNGAQGKAFTANSNVVERRGTVGTFYLQPTLNEKSFGTTSVVTTAEYRHREFLPVPKMTSPGQSRDANVTANANSSTAYGDRQADDGRRQVAGRSFAVERSFHDEGKSQKSLNRQNPPLTIDQVRELLNKNK
jgi:hypothetical protein